MSAALADWIPGTGTAVPALTAAGLLAAVPAAATGAGDWSELPRPLARVGVVHACVNVAAMSANAGSLIARARRHRRSARSLTLIGAGLLGVSSGLGAHMFAASPPTGRPATGGPLGVPPSRLSDEDLDRELGTLHRTRADTFQHASDNAMAVHTERLAALEGEYLRRHPARDVDPRRLREGGRAASTAAQVMVEEQDAEPPTDPAAPDG